MIHLKIEGTADDLPDVIKALAGFRILDIGTTYTKNENIDTPQARASRAVEIARRRAHGLDTPPPIG